MTNALKIMPTSEEILFQLNKINGASQFNGFYNSIAKCEGKSLTPEGVMMVFNLALLEANDAAALSFEAAPRQFIRALVGDDKDFIDEVVELLIVE